MAYVSNTLGYHNIMLCLSAFPTQRKLFCWLVGEGGGRVVMVMTTLFEIFNDYGTPEWFCKVKFDNFILKLIDYWRFATPYVIFRIRRL